MNEAARVALIVPTYNEEESVGWVLTQIPEGAIQRIIVADGGSTDRTAVIASAAGADVLTVGRGFGRACLEGSIAAADADVLVFMDGDGADDPGYIPALVQPILNDEADFVIGSRIRGTREPGSMAWHQVAAGRMAGAGIYLVSGVRFTDMCTFRAIRRQTLLDLSLCEMTYGWNIEMQVRAARAGLRIREIPVRYRCRHGGTSKVAGNLGTSLKAGALIAATFVRVGLSGGRRSASSKL